MVLAIRMARLVGKSSRSVFVDIFAYAGLPERCGRPTNLAASSNRARRDYLLDNKILYTITKKQVLVFCPTTLITSRISHWQFAAPSPAQTSYQSDQWALTDTCNFKNKTYNPRLITDKMDFYMDGAAENL